MLGGLRRKLAADANVRSARFFRFINEVPTLMMIVIVIAVIVVVLMGLGQGYRC